jgi:hypothetical protein
MLELKDAARRPVIGVGEYLRVFVHEAQVEFLFGYPDNRLLYARQWSAENSFS